MNSVSLDLVRPFCKVTATFSTDTISVLPASQLADLVASQQALAAWTPTRVTLIVPYEDDLFSHGLAALEVLNNLPRNHELIRLLVGERYDTLPREDIYRSIRHILPHPEIVTRLNGHQKEAILQAGRAPSGVVNIMGPPGTGKTFFAKEAIRPFWLDETREHRVGAFATTNKAADQLATMYQLLADEIRQENPEAKARLVIRYHGPQTEEEVVCNDANLTRPMPANARPQTFRDPTAEEESTLRQLEIALVTQEQYKETRVRKFPGIGDERVQNLDMSLGKRMLQIAGVIPSPYTVTEDFSGFVESLRQYRAGQYLFEEDNRLFRMQRKRLREYTVRNADAICTTVANTCVAQIRNLFKPRICILDEASRDSETSNLGFFAYFQGAHGRFILGDKMQLTPRVNSKPATNNFARDQALSIQARLSANGFPETIFRVQYRAVPEIAAIYSKLTYGQTLINAPSTEIAQRPLAQRIKAFNLQNYRKDHPVVFFHIPKGRSQKFGAGASSFCEENAKVVLNHVASLLAANFSSSDITILTPYQAQYRIYNSGIDRMARIHTPWKCKEIVVAKVDGYQGHENEIVILDLVNTIAPGFLHFKNRINLGISRARNGFYLAGNQNAIHNFKAKPGKHLKALLSEVDSYMWKFNDPVDCQYYRTGQVDLSNA